MDKVLSCYTIYFVSDYNKLNQAKQVSNINIFLECGRVIFDTGTADACNSHKSNFIKIKVKINPKNLKLIGEGFKI